MVNEGSATGAMVVVENVEKRFVNRDRRRVAGSAPPGVAALAGVSFQVERGRLVSLLGPSGCGKTTLLRIIAGLATPDNGRVTVDGQPVCGPRRDRAMVFQHFGLLPWRTVLQNVAFPLELDGMRRGHREEVARQYIDLVGLRGVEGRYPHELSGGMQQRVGIARALTRRPVLLLMDEPFGALDAQTREQLQDEFLQVLKVTQHTVLFVTHSIDEALVLSDRIIVFTPSPGRIRSVIDVPTGRAATGSDVRATPEFAKWGAQIRDLLRSERR